MYIVKILKRKDAASVVVAIALGIILVNVLQVLTHDLSNYMSGIEGLAAPDWRDDVVQPLVAAALQVIVLEAVLRAVIYVRPLFVRKRR